MVRAMTDSIPPLLVLHLKSSFRLALMLSLAHVSAGALLWPLTLPFAVKLAATAALALQPGDLSEALRIAKLARIDNKFGPGGRHDLHA